MTVHISPCDDPARIAPILRVLRDQQPDAVFDARLGRALTQGARVLLAETDVTLGCLCYHLAHDVYWGKTLYIDDLVVQPEARDRGVGAALLDAAKAQAHATDCDHIRLCSGLARVDAHRFYERHGLSPTSLQFAYALSLDGEV